MMSYQTRRVIQVVLMVLVVVVVGFALVAISRALLPTDESVAKIQDGKSALLNTSADRSVKMSVRGEIIANENFRSYTIIATPSSRSFITYQGYTGNTLSNTELTNNTPAYEQFVYALNRAGMMNAAELTGDQNDTRGVCASGNLYEFEILKSDKTVKNLWTTTCSSVAGSLSANLNEVRGLFISQIPGAQSAIGGLWQ
jgi:hypothetical protein